MSDRFASFLVNYRQPFALASLFILCLALVGLPRLEFNGDFRHMFSKDNIQLNLLDEIENTYIQSDQLLVLIQYPVGDVFVKENLLHTKSITEKLWQTPYSLHVESLTTTSRSYSRDDTFYIEALIPDPESLSSVEIEDIREYVRHDEYISKGLVSEDFQVTSIVINFSLPTDAVDRMFAMNDLVEFVEDLVTEEKLNQPGIVIHYLGGPALEVAMIGLVKSDMFILMPLCFVLVFFLLGVMLRTGVSVFGTIFTIAISLAVTMGLAGWMGFGLNPTAAMAPIMVALLAMADSVHLLTQYIIEFRKGYGKIEAMERSIASNFKPILLTSVTTAIGFLGMNLSDSPAFHDFGSITAIGVLVAFVVTLTITPVVVLWMPINADQKPLPLSELLLKISRFSIAHQRKLFLCVIVLVPIVASFIPKLHFNDDVIEYFRDDVPFKQTVKFASENMSGFYYILYSLDSGKPGYVNDPTFLKKVESFQDWLRQQKEVTLAVSYVDIVKNLNMAMHDDDPAWKIIPDSRELASQYMLLYEMSLPAGTSLSRDINSEHSSLRLRVSMNAMSNQELLALDERVQSWLQANAPELNARGASRSLMFANLGLVVLKSMAAGSLIALALISLVIMIGIGSIRFGLISLIPNIIPSVVVYGCWALLVGEVNQTAAIVFSMSLGLVVDDTVHFMTKYLKGREEGLSVEESIEFSFSTAGVALTVTTVALVLGMSVNLLSSFIPNITTALMMMCIISVALLLDLFFLPGLLINYERWHKRFFSR